jgi:hypothetical protein
MFTRNAKSALSLHPHLQSVWEIFGGRHLMRVHYLRSWSGKIASIWPIAVAFCGQVACQPLNHAAGSFASQKADGATANAAAAFALEGEGDSVYVNVTLRVQRFDVVLCVGPKQDCAKDDVPVINLISNGNGTLRSEQPVNLQNGIEDACRYQSNSP